MNYHISMRDMPGERPDPEVAIDITKEVLGCSKLEAYHFVVEQAPIFPNYTDDRNLEKLSKMMYPVGFHVTFR